MSDDRIIDFNHLKNKAKDSDVDKFEQYIYNLYFSVMDGSMTMAEFSKKIFDYMKDNNISYEKFMNIQKKFMERYGMNPQEVEDQLKSFGIDPANLDMSNISEESINSIKNTTSFYEKYANKIQTKGCVTTYIKNDTNDIEVIIDKEKVILCSSKKINLVDAELNEFLLGYKNVFNNKIKIVLCENCTNYDY
ncbi:DUF3867 domain-containing protein [Romboutsia sp. 1001713B170131_170501_G6]|uniref:DUF3867 domain-containing protein n=1 Tax=Romboutsia sp. 1001713B170131_170501_G6 TaxID=2787108 RepID=UPI0018AA60C0|nr:DUF3867 domain-containing protein [Romboutsia sp. 1001713B170131_170501_G6]